MQYDILVMGSGLGGLQCAAMLSKEGYHVCVLEKNEQFGGALQIYRRDGVTLDTGVHYIGALDPGQVLHKIFNYQGIIDKLPLKRMDENGFDRIQFEGEEQEYNLAMGYERFASTLKEHFPLEKDAIDKYCSEINRICGSVDLYNLRAPKEGNFFTESHTIEVQQFLESITSNKRLQQVLVGNNLLYAGESGKTPLYVHAMITNTYVESAWRVVGGGQQLANILVRQIRQNGGTVLRLKHITEFIWRGNDIIGVKTIDGMEVLAKSFISNMNPSFTHELLVPGGFRKSYIDRIRKMEHSVSAFTLHILLEEGVLPYFNHNHYHFSGDEVWVNHAHRSMDRWPENLLIFTPASQAGQLYADNLSVMCTLPFSEVLPWADTCNLAPDIHERDPAYTEWKWKMSERILDKIYALYPMIKGKVRSIHASTPLSYRDYLGADQGAIYGIVKDYRHPMEAYIPHRTKVPNLFLCGQDVNLHGIYGVSITSLLATSEFVGMDYLLAKING